MTEERKIKIAKTIKNNSRYLLLSLIIGVLSYPIISYFNGGFKALSLKSEFEQNCLNSTNSDCENIQNRIIELGNKYETSENYEQTFPIQNIDRLVGGGEAKGTQLWERYQNMYKGTSQVVGLQRFEDFVKINLTSYSTTLENTINRAFGIPAIIDAFCVFILCFIIIVIGKLIYRSVKWTKKYSK